MPVIRDVHHGAYVRTKEDVRKYLTQYPGNGTQRAFNDDPSVLFISLHRYEGGRFYPCGPFGGMTSCGEGRGLG